MFSGNVFSPPLLNKYLHLKERGLAFLLKYHWPNLEAAAREFTV